MSNLVTDAEAKEMKELESLRLIRWLLSEADKRERAARSRRDSAAVMREATGDELKAAKQLAEQLAGRKLYSVSTSLNNAKVEANIDDKIADRMDSDSELLRLASRRLSERERLLSERERLLAIVRAMTNREPYYRDEDANLNCSICGTLLPDFGEADNHDPTCPYRLATQYMAEVTK